MSHLTIETLARLVEETPASHEAAHLDRCEECRSELEGLKADAIALSELPAIDPPASQWLAVEQRLIAEGLLRAPARSWAARRWTGPLLQMAAAIAIFVLGSYTAPLLRGQPEAQSAALTEARANNGNAALVNTPSAAATGTREEAALAVRDAERAYLAALTRYTELAGRTETADPLARLAALESIVLTTRAALGQAPADPVINGYHLTALAQRDATLKHLSSTNGQTWF